MKPSLNQISFLVEVLKRDQFVSDTFVMDDAWSKLQEITSGQIKFFHALMINKNYNQLGNLMTQFGFKYK
jgi:hypothetical protein